MGQNSDLGSVTSCGPVRSPNPQKESQPLRANCVDTDGHGRWSTGEEGWSQPGGQILSSHSTGSFPGVDQCLWKLRFLQRSAIDQAGRKTGGGDRDE